MEYHGTAKSLPTAQAEIPMSIFFSFHVRVQFTEWSPIQLQFDLGMLIAIEVAYVHHVATRACWPPKGCAPSQRGLCTCCTQPEDHP